MAETQVIDNLQAAAQFAMIPMCYSTIPSLYWGYPLCRKVIVMGVLYLENNLMTGAFTCDRINVLQHSLCSGRYFPRKR
jgi:GAF domain-containing protein